MGIALIVNENVDVMNVRNVWCLVWFGLVWYWLIQTAGT